MKKELLEFLDTSERALIVGDMKSRTTIYCNQQAETLYGLTMESDKKTDFQYIFMENFDIIAKLYHKELVSKKSMFYFNVLTRKLGGDLQLADLQIGYINEAKESAFIEITPKTDNRLEMAFHQIDNSNRAEGVLEFDEKLSLIKGNNLFHAVFECTEEIRHSHYGNYFCNGFHPDIREELLAEIHATLKNSSNFFSKIKVITASGKVNSYSLELQRRTLDNTGRDKIMAYLTNIEDLEVMEQKFDKIHSQFDVLQEMSDDLLIYIDIPNKILTRKSNKISKFGLAEQVTNFPESITHSDHIHPDDIEIYISATDKVMAGIGGTAEVRLKSTTTNRYEYRRLIWMPVENKGKVTEVIGKIVDIQAMKDLEHQALFDPLTNVLNKGAMLEATSHHLQHPPKKDYHALLFLDLDDFKYVNDHFGHSFGDFLLKTLAERLQINTRTDDIVGRVGGDEFIIFLKDIPTLDIVKTKAEQLLRSTSRPVVDREQSHCINGSIGIAVYPDHGRTYEELYHHADLALYRSKQSGKNMVTLYQPD